ncbi:MAG: sigma-70 family RNA polymerase sigma factor [Planctomycetota bacterium]
MHPSPDDLLQDLEWVRGLAARLVFDPHQRADLEQEIWHAALRGAPATGVPVRAWLAGIAHNLAAMWHRSTGRRVRREQAVASDGAAPAAATLVEHAELQQRLLGAVNALPAEMRDVVLLRFLEGLPPRAIARQLGIPVATVRTRLQRAQGRLRERLDAEFGERRTWSLLLLALPRPRHVAAAAGTVATFTQLTLVLMTTHKLIAAAAAALALAAIPAALLWSGPHLPAPPDYGRATPVASLLERHDPRPVAPPSTAVAERTDGAEMPTRAAFHGRVVDGKGAPIAGAGLRLWPDWSAEGHLDEGARPDQLQTMSGADGSFTLEPFRAEKWGILLAARHPDYIAIAERTACRPDATATIVMLRTHEVPLVVEVRDRSTNTPAPNFRVVASTTRREPDQPANVAIAPLLQAPERGRGDNGVFTGTARFVEGLPLEVSVQCTGDGLSSWSNGREAAPRSLLTPSPGEPIRLRFEVEFGRAEALARSVQRGRIVDARTEQPVAGVSIGWYRDAKTQNYRYGQSRADGSFVIALPDDGTLPQLSFEHDDHQSTTLDADPQREALVRLTPLASLTCRIVDRDGAPVPRAPLLIKSSTHDRFQERRRSDELGQVRLDRLQAGRYTVNVLRRYSDADDHALTSVTWRVDPGQDLQVTLATATSDAVRVVGTIVGGPDGLVPMFVPHGGEARWIQGRANGRTYDAGGVRRGLHLVVLLPADDGRKDLPTILLPRVAVAGLGSTSIDLAVPTGAVRGRILTKIADRPNLRVLAIPEVPAGGLAAELLANSKLAGSAGIAVAPDGSFAVPYVANGNVRLEVHDGAKVLATRTIQVLGTADLPDWPIDR